MIFSDSPVKNIAEKLNPLSQRNKISKLKFERKKDYKTFLDFIKKNTKELEQRDNIVEKTKKVGLVAGGLGIAALLFGSVKGKRESDDLDNLRKNLIPKAIQRAKREREREERRGTGSDTSRSLQKVSPAISNLLSKIIQKPGGALTTTSSSATTSKQNVKSKQKVKESIINQETVYNKNRRKKLSTTNITVRQPVGAGTGGGKITPPERPQIFENPIDRINADRIKKGLKPLNPKLSKIGFDPKSGMIDIGALDERNFDAKTGRTNRPSPPRSGQTPFDENLDLKKLMGMDIEPPRVNDKNFKNLSKLFSGEIGSDDLDTLIKMDRMFEKDGNRPIKMFDRRPSLSERFMFNPNSNRAGGSRFTSLGNFFGRESFTAPSIPKGQPKLSGFEKINRLSNSILNSPVAKFTTFLGGLFASPKVEIIKQLLTPTQLGPTDEEERRLIEQFSEKPVNIFLNNGQSMLPFNQDLKLSNDVIPPTDFPTPSSNVFIDPKQQLNIDDLFFLRSFSGG